MKHLSDENISKELEQLGEAFRPSSVQKEKMHRYISTQTRPKKPFHVRKLLPTLLSVIVLFSVGFGLYIGLGESESANVTSSWDQLAMQQLSHTSATNYTLIFDGSTLTIEDYYINNPELAAMFTFKFKEPLLVAGTYENYTVKQKGDTFTIKVSGEGGFTYKLEKKGPRIFVGEDGIEFHTWRYLEEVINDMTTPERLDIATQSEHTFLIEWGSDTMDRGDHDFETHEHGKLVVSTDFSELKRGQPVYYHMPPSEIAKNSAIPEMYIGRVVGLPGETVEIKGGQVYIDGKKLDTFYGKATVRGMGEEEYFRTAPKRNLAQSWRDYFNMDVAAVTVQENTVYLLVDHWWRGTDSRDFGPLPIEKIEGIILGYEK
ncbi:signal peptidase I [Sporosarcina thermotolerans]|uniref:Signal peptidase I n=1 Tax=Sporosarcina thermotolerans TaxID=633404 RepID=A0AAW9AEE5_9BACL|nr:signal peptidase I [Sporosarcina thermotolerans]MDW0117506.1 signal peptidase I [Sporosarcina thermotolerans]WHT49675.1 signal peptidase I [Sporosarcina thermotolerans]